MTHCAYQGIIISIQKQAILIIIVMKEARKVYFVLQPHFDNKPLGDDYHLDTEYPQPINETIEIEHNNLTNLAFNGDKHLLDTRLPSVYYETAKHWSGQTAQGKCWNIYLGDSHTILRALPESSFQCVVTSPPYYWLRDYGVEGQIGKEWTIGEYIEAVTDVMDQVKRVLANDGVLFLNMGDTYYSGKGRSHGIDKKSSKRRFGLRAVDATGLGVPQKSMIGIPWRVALEMVERGWILRSSIIWDREHALPEAVRDRPGRSYEYVFMFVKSRKYYFNQEALDGQRADIWTISARPRATPGISTAAFPDELAQKCIDVGCSKDGKVLDPFAGSGTVLRVALQSGREATGIDIHPDFCNYMVKDLSCF